MTFVFCLSVSDHSFLISEVTTDHDRHLISGTSFDK